MDSNYLLQVDYHEHRTDHPDYRHPYPSTYSHDDPQFWPYAYPTQSTQYPRYISSQCDPQPEVAAPPFVYDQSAQPVDDFATPTRLGIFDISAMHAPVGSAEPWGPRSEGQCHSFVSPSPFLSSRSLTTSAHTSRNPVNFDNQVILSQNSLAQANPYYPVPVPSPPWVHPSPSSDATPPTSNSPSSSLAHYASAPISPPPATELLPTNPVVDARAQDASEDVVEPAPQSPPATRSTQATGRRPGACSRCKKLKVRAHSSIEFLSSGR